MHLRKATLDDAPACFTNRREAILAQCPGFHAPDDLAIWTAGDMSHAFARRVAEHFHVVKVAGCVVGTGMIDLVSGRIDAVFVLPDHMGRGIGRVLMNHLEGLAIGAGLQSTQLEATLNVAPFYRGLGFEGDLPSIYASSLGVRLACVPMKKRLQPVSLRVR